MTRLAEEKKLSFSDPLSRYVASFPKADAITIDQLVNHRSGIRDPDKLRRIIAASYTPAEVAGGGGPRRSGRERRRGPE